jgi:DNA-binding beta-propeller fold protein YncE
MGADGSLVATARGETLVFFNPERQVTLVIPAAVSSVSNDSELDTRLAVDGLGNVYALGTFNDAVFKFSPQGRFLTRFGSAGDGNGQFRAPLDIAADALGRVYVSDVKGVQVFDADGRYLASIQVPGAAFGLAFDDLNRLYVVTNTPKVLRFQVQEP